MARVPAPERRLKKKNEDEKKTKMVAKVQAKRISKRKEMLKRGVATQRQYTAARKHLVTRRRQAAKQGFYYVEPEAKVAFVVRIRGINDMPPKPKKILQLLRLRQIFNGVFVRLTKATIAMLRLIQPYVAWGYPSLASVRQLVYKRGHAKHKGQRLRLDNDLIEKCLGKRANVVCMEDIVRELYFCGPNFKAVSSFLWPFKLSAPSGGLQKKRHHFTEGGDNGNREHFMNAFIRKLN